MIIELITLPFALYGAYSIYSGRAAVIARVKAETAQIEHNTRAIAAQADVAVHQAETFFKAEIEKALVLLDMQKAAQVANVQGVGNPGAVVKSTNEAPKS